MRGRTNSHYGMLPELVAWYHKEKGIKRATARTLQLAVNDCEPIESLWKGLFSQMPAHRLWEDSLLLVEVNRVLNGRRRGTGKKRKVRSRTTGEELEWQEM